MSDDLSGDLNALNELLVNCPDFERLEALLGGFNLFQVLKFEHGEIRHSNVLAWILNPTENHGLGDAFLKKWLMRLLHESSSDEEAPCSAAAIDGWRILDVEVRREWKHIDVLVLITVEGGGQWLICIENKVNSSQHSNQLSRYRQTVEGEFRGARGRIFVFLTRDEEPPEDKAYLPATYAQVHRCLREAVDARSHAIGAEPRVLIENYLRLLEEKFMDQSEIARTALRIYQQHRRALDILFEHRPDSIRQTSEAVREKLAASADALGLTLPVANKFYVRFLPKAWDVEANRRGKAWAGLAATVTLELVITAERARLQVMAGLPPPRWIEPVWELAAHAPFKRSRRKPTKWYRLHKVGDLRYQLDGDDGDEPAEVAERIVAMVRTCLAEAATRQVIEILAAELPKLAD